MTQPSPEQSGLPLLDESSPVITLEAIAERRARWGNNELIQSRPINVGRVAIAGVQAFAAQLDPQVPFQDLEFAPYDYLTESQEEALRGVAHDLRVLGQADLDRQGIGWIGLTSPRIRIGVYNPGAPTNVEASWHANMHDVRYVTAIGSLAEGTSPSPNFAIGDVYRDHISPLRARLYDNAGVGPDRQLNQVENFGPGAVARLQLGDVLQFPQADGPLVVIVADLAAPERL